MPKQHVYMHLTKDIARLAPLRLIAIVPLLFAPLLQISAQTVLPSGFGERQYATALTNPTAMAFAPDPCPASGTPVRRLFVCEQAGTVRVFRNGSLRPTPFLTVNADTRGERGLDGICFDPNFAANGYVYFYYTIRPTNDSTPTHNRVIRVTADPANPDVALLGSARTILDLPDLGLSSYVHNGSCLRFGPDGKLYIAVGENGNGLNSQSLNTVFGKILRVNPVPENPDGTNPESTFPTDNPFYNTATGLNRAIYCLGLRNPFTFAFQPGTGRMFIDDVGASTWEEINEGRSGRNYGWPDVEGPASPPVNGVTNPIFGYHHFPNQGGTQLGCAITGGTFYNPPPRCSGDPPFGFPSSYEGLYFFLDLCGGWIYTLDPAQIDPTSPYGFRRATEFASGIHGSPTYLTLGPDKNLYYISRDDGAVYQIRYPASLAPTIGAQPADVLVGQGWPATFSVEASGSPPLHYRWQRNDVDIPGAADSPSYTLQNPTVAADNGATFRCVISNSYGSTHTRETVLSVTTKQPPVCTISSPAPSTYYEAGDTITFSGSAVDGHDIVTGDPQDGVLGPSAFTWQVLFEHHPLNNPNHHTHPFYPPTSGITGGTFTIPRTGETDPDVWFRIFFTARDSYGLSTTIVREIYPRHVKMKVTTSPVPLRVKIDASPQDAPYPFWSVVHLIRSIGVDSPQVLNGLTYDFVSWSDEGARFHNVSVPRTATGYVANFWKRLGYGSITANPDPMRVNDGSGKGATTLYWSSGQTNQVEVRLGAPGGQLIARSGPGSFSQLTNKSIRDGTKVYLQDVSNNQSLTRAYTLDSVTLHVIDTPLAIQSATATGSITADPNPFLANAQGVGQTNLAWSSYGTTAVEIHVNAPNGPRFAGGDPGSFSVATGRWVVDGMTFYLQNVSNGLPLTAANTLATVTMSAVSGTPSGSMSANPNPFTPNAQGLGQTTLAWTSAGTNRVELHVNAPNGNRLAATGPGSFSVTTGQWARDGMTFYLQNVSSGLPLTSANTLATVTVTAR